ncbi:MAG: tRNA pseudouridine synthase A [Gemmatimonadetes bacterium]|nr:MAG: tRNA pseudouridine synthase A [Gemmatimonadota bacterium]
MQKTERTVQGVLEAALERLTGAPRPVIGSGRTDRGVHATGQVAAVTVPDRWDAGSLRKALNAVLPDDVWVAHAEAVPLEFHPRYDALRRSYEYRVGTSEQSRSPFHRRTCWPLGRELDRDALDAAAAALPGRHSFRAFARAGQPERGEYCTVEEAAWSAWGDLGVRFTITADRYLHHMVRYLVGTQVEIALGRRQVADLGRLLDDPDAGTTSPPAPPEGLFLTHVEYGPPPYTGRPHEDRAPEESALTP